MRTHVKVRQRKRKGSVSVVLDYHDGTKRVQHVFGSAVSADGLAIVMAEATKEAARLEVKLMDGLYRPRVGEMPILEILAEFGKHVEGSNRRPSTKSMYRYMLTRFGEFLKTTTATRAKDLTPELIVRFVHSQSGSAPDTVRSSLIVLGTCFSRAVDRGVMVSNPCRHADVAAVKPSTRKHERIFSPEEMERFFAAAAEYKHPWRQDLADYFTLLADTGLRATEGLMVRWCDVNLDPSGRFLRVAPREDWQPKTRTSARCVGLSSRVEDMLRRRLRDLAEIKPTDRVFPANWAYNVIGTHFRNILALAKLDGDDHDTRLRVHSFRHTFATEMLRAGVDAGTVSTVLGHSSLQMTDRYISTPVSAVLAGRDLFDQARNNGATTRANIERFPAAKAGNSSNA